MGRGREAPPPLCLRCPGIAALSLLLAAARGRRCGGGRRGRGRRRRSAAARFPRRVDVRRAAAGRAHRAGLHRRAARRHARHRERALARPPARARLHGELLRPLRARSIARRREAVDEHDGAIGLLGIVGEDDVEGGREYAEELDLGHPVAVAGERIWLDYAAREPGSRRARRAGREGPARLARRRDDRTAAAAAGGALRPVRRSPRAACSRARCSPAARSAAATRTGRASGS